MRKGDGDMEPRLSFPHLKLFQLNVHWIGRERMNELYQGIEEKEPNTFRRLKDLKLGFEILRALRRLEMVFSVFCEKEVA